MPPCGRKPNFAEEHEGGTGIIAAVEAGRGIALVPSSLACIVGTRVKLIPLKPALAADSRGRGVAAGERLGAGGAIHGLRAAAASGYLKNVGRTYQFECPYCQYRAKVSGGADSGVHCEVQTVVCRDCRELIDVFTKVRRLAEWK